MHTQLSDLYKRLAECEDQELKRQLILEGAELLAKLFAAALHLHGDEVALQAVVTDGNALRFLFPQVLYQSGATFPISTSSIAGSAVKMRRANFNNKINDRKHLLFYEMLNTGVRPPMPIQKMATIPMISEGNVVGVVQLSRRAKSLEEAGPDFSSADLALLNEPLTLATAFFADHIYGQL